MNIDIVESRLTYKRLVKDTLLFIIVFFFYSIVILFAIANSPKLIRIVFSAILKYPIGLSQSVVFAASQELSSRINEHYDYLIIGSSHTSAAFNVPYLEENGLNVFNLSTASQRPIDSYFFYLSLRNKIKSERIIIDASPNLFNTVSGEGFERLLLAYPELEQYGTEFLCSNRDFHTMFIYVIQILRRNMSDPYEARSGTNYIKGGYFEYPVAQRSIPKPFKCTDIIHHTQLTYFSLLIETCKEDSIDIVVITPPLSPYSLHYNTNYNNFAATISDICSKRNISYLDFNKLSVYPVEEYYDSNHLNTSGSIHFVDDFISHMNFIRYKY